MTKADVKISMDGRGRYLDNIFIERRWRSMKQEAVYLHEITNGFQAKRIIDEWIGFCNTERPHTALDKRGILPTGWHTKSGMNKQQMHLSQAAKLS